MKKIIIIEIILALTIVYIIKNIPGYKNTVLILRNDIKIEREEAFEKDEKDLFMIKRYIYVKEISNINEIWIGKTYSYDELKKTSLSFRWLINEERLSKEKYDKESGYFIIDANKEFYSLTEQEVKQKLNINDLKLKSVESYMKKYGKKPIFSDFYQNYLSTIKSVKGNLPFYKENVDDENFEKRELNYTILFKNIILVILILNFCSYPYLLKKNKLKIDLEKLMLIIVFFFTDSIVLVLSFFFTKPWDYINNNYIPIYVVFHIIFRNITTALYFVKIEKVLKNFDNISQNDILEKFKKKETIMLEEIKKFLMIKVALLYLAPLFFTVILSVIGTALMTIFYFFIFFISLLYCFYSFIKIEDNPLNSTFYISVYLLQYILFIFIILHF
ncbi:hypothetical protein [Fusobacterium pseudoperiodonticum]|uniref:Uncharacterized protein n=1 Tax=Fusobacterium pseudoperiodonticum TaxID=2663009 RepID=A0AAD0ANQ5_9FUSO|nr:hypothetical protein [Fusobacterium pseudoperiodonticum]ATV36896.1 hypothetical protein CTM64_13615 [Fusobacterium pseudoperiodonticum]ATV62576.1 hypothetical protein CTM74_12515 [Fusobacterium pseudoperiodonticum]